MGRMKDLLYTGVYDMGQTDDLLRENMILQKNIKELQGQLNQAHQRIKHLVDTKWADNKPDPNQMDLKLNE